MALATDHVRYLRGLAHSLSPIVLIGNKGISDNLLDELKQALDRHELVKLRVLAETREERDQLVVAVQKHTGAELVQRVGHTATLYRQHPTRPKIALPGSRPKGLGTGAGSSERSATPRRDAAAPGPAPAGHDGNMPFRRDADERPPTARPAAGRFTRDSGPRPARADSAERGRFSPPSARTGARPGARPGAARFERDGARPIQRDAAGRFQRDAGARPVRRDSVERPAFARPGAARFGRDASAKPFRRDSTERSPTGRPPGPGAAARFERDGAPRPYRRDSSEGSARPRPGAGQRSERDAAARPFRADSKERGPTTRPGSRPGAAPRFERDAAPRPFRRDASESSARARPGAPQRFERDAAAKPLRRERSASAATPRPGARPAAGRFDPARAAKPDRRDGTGVVRESVGAPRRERGALKPPESGQRGAGGNPYSAWSGAGKGADSTAAPGARRAPASTTDRPRRPGPPGARGTRPPRPR